MLAVLGYALIGFVTGLISKKYMPGKVVDGSISLSLLGIFGAVTGGLLCLALFSYGRAYDYLYGYTHVYSSDNGATLPAYWMSFLTAMIGAILVLAVYKLVKGKWTQP